jgi:hypothetical protein
MAEGTEAKPKLTEISSFMGDLPFAVQKFWNAVAQPFFELSISLVVVFFTLGGYEITQGSFSAQANAIPRLCPDNTYGIQTLVPLAVIVFLIGIAQGNSKLLRIIGAAIPGQLVPNRAALLMQNASQLEIVEAWQYNSNLGDIWQLNTEIDAAISRLPFDQAKDTLSNVRTMQNRSDSAATTASFIKGLFAATVVVNVMLKLFESWPMHWGRLAIVFAAASIASIYLAFRRIQSEREYASRKVGEYNFQKKMLGLARAPEEFRPRALDEVSRLYNYFYSRRAWALRLVSPDVGNDLGVLGDTILRIGRY